MFFAVYFLLLTTGLVNLFVGCGDNAKSNSARFSQAYPPGARKEIVTEKDGATMSLIPAGEFIMGSADTEANEAEQRWGLTAGMLKSETPQHIVFVDAFYLDKYEVTNAQYQKFVYETKHPPPSVPTTEQVLLAFRNELGDEAKAISTTQLENTYRELKRQLEPWAWQNGTYPAGKANHPVVLVRWYDVVAYAKWANKRLPTEAEWEKAARGTDGRVYPWGNDWDAERCNSAERVAQKALPNLQASLLWFAEWKEIPPVETAPNTTVPVGSYKRGKSPFGVYDMAGNAFEWCMDWYDEDYYTKSPKKNPTGPITGHVRVLRGGSWNYPGFKLRTTYRNKHAPEIGGSPNGFRCAMDVAESLKDAGEWIED